MLFEIARQGWLGPRLRWHRCAADQRGYAQAQNVDLNSREHDVGMRTFRSACARIQNGLGAGWLYLTPTAEPMPRTHSATSGHLHVLRLYVPMANENSTTTRQTIPMTNCLKILAITNLTPRESSLPRPEGPRKSRTSSSLVHQESGRMFCRTDKRGPCGLAAKPL